jgi:hypothetical protein
LLLKAKPAGESVVLAVSPDDILAKPSNDILDRSQPIAVGKAALLHGQFEIDVD